MAIYTPSLEEVDVLAETGNWIPIYRELPADLETPVSAYLKLRTGKPSFLLESVEGGERLARYSFLGSEPLFTLFSKGDKVRLDKRGEEEIPLNGADPLHFIKKNLGQYKVAHLPDLPRFLGGAVGYLSYDMVRFLEELPATAEDDLHLPECYFLFTDTLVVFDHVKHRLMVIAGIQVNGRLEETYQEAKDKIDEIVARLQAPTPIQTKHPVLEPQDTEPFFTADQFKAKVRRVKEYITAGDTFQVVLSQRLQRQTRIDPFSIYRTLRQLNPSPYMFYLELPHVRLIGSSPETLVRLEKGVAEVRPIAGTRPRGDNEAQDQSLEQDLLNDPKERAEHIMLVDLGRNDLGRVCGYGTIEVPQLFGVERYSHVMHMVSRVTRKLQPEYDAYDLLRASFPAGTVSGAPKVRAMEIIEELEGVRRGPYAGAVGYFDYSGNMDTCITIRTIVMKGETACLQAGAGIVADSVPEREHQECLSKIRALDEAITLAEKGVLGGAQ